MAIEGPEFVRAAACFGAALAMGFGALGPALGEGLVAMKTVEAISKNAQESGLLVRTMIMGQAITETTGIYALVVALLLLFVV